MIRFEHANLVVKEIEPTLNFLLVAFPEWQVRGSGKGQWQNKPREWLHVGNDDYYITLNDSAEGEIRKVEGIKPGLAHLGFIVTDLDALVERLDNHGFKPEIIGRAHPFRKTVYYRDPAGFQFEFLQYLSEEPQERNLYGGESGELTHSPAQKTKENTANPAVLINGKAFLANLYHAVDNKDLQFLNRYLADNVQFRIGNSPVMTGKAEVLAANEQFFGSIRSMSHRLEGSWQDADQLICKGQVDYVRLDGSKTSASFSTFLTVHNGLISDYIVHADLSEL